MTKIAIYDFDDLDSDTYLLLHGPANILTLYRSIAARIDLRTG